MKKYAILKESRYIRKDGSLDEKILDYEFYNELFDTKERCFSMAISLCKHWEKLIKMSKDCFVEIDRENNTIICLYKEKGFTTGCHFVYKIVKVEIDD